MRIIDISTDAFTAPNYADDPQPMYKWIRKLGGGSEYNLSVMGMTPHSGTHIDAPLHFVEDGDSADMVALDKCYGSCTVVTLSGVLTGEDMDKLLSIVYHGLYFFPFRIVLRSAGSYDGSLRSAAWIRTAAG